MKHKFLLLLAFLCCSLGAWASGYSIKKTHFYYDNTRSGWETNATDSIMIYFHKSGYGQAYSMKRVENTNLYYYYRDNEWKEAEEIAFIFIKIANKSNFTGSSASRSNSGSLGYTGYKTLSSGLDSKYCIGRPTGETFVNDATLHWDTKSEWGTEDADKDLRKAVLYRKQTLKVYLSTNGSTYSSSDATWYGSFCVNSYLFKDTKKTTTEASVKNLSTSDKTVTGIRSSVQTFTESNTTEGYRFKGWGRSNTAPTVTDNPFEFTVEANDADIYAFFEQGRAITTVCSDAKGSITAGAAITYFAGDATTITATPALSYYEFDHWDVPSGITVESTTSASTTVTSASNGGTITAYFHEVPRSINVASEDNAKGTVTPTSEISYTVGTTPTIEATVVDDHYAFDYWDVPSGISVSNDHAASTTITAADNNGTITAHFKKVGVDLTITAAGYASYYGAENLIIPSGITAQYVTDWNNTILSWETLNEYIPAETGVILSGAPGTYVAYVTAETETADGNMLKGSLTDEVINNTCVHYILSAESDGSRVGLYWPNEATVDDNTGVGQFTNKAKKAYLELPASGASLAPRRYVFGANQMPTDIENVQPSANSSRKMFLNGQLFIRRGEHTYNAQGKIVK